MADDTIRADGRAAGELRPVEDAGDTEAGAFPFGCFDSADRPSGARAAILNGKKFSYPGYSELLVGFHDPRIDSNAKRPNPNSTVLEFVNRQPAMRGRVAAFGSWDVFPYIVNEERSGILVNAASLHACSLARRSAHEVGQAGEVALVAQHQAIGRLVGQHVLARARLRPAGRAASSAARQRSAPSRGGRRGLGGRRARGEDGSVDACRAER